MTCRGTLVVLEGVDRSGKTTQVKMLVEELVSQGKKAELMCFPDRTTQIGQMINAYLTNSAEISDQAIHLLFSANRWEHATKINKLLESGTTVFCDRYAFSGVAFSAAKGLPRAWCKGPDVGLPEPDLVCFLELTPEQAASRGGFGQERYEKKELQEKVLSEFHALAAETPHWRTIDAARPVEEIYSELKQAVLDTIHCSGEKPIGKLWASAFPCHSVDFLFPDPL
eukprot:TRINITY_DN8730_c0_g1::TRINITY_DN8730_c0_g1_i1::g.23840::m.23840 TRINITY_DN8730_c0_g1::TRINITY_DN8730_c0_g1_i1::g.23840  ORF type:complete len:226 (+),score=30.59,sp/P23919/KTHY_HUMAN/49.28/4e-70,Thymidylate_kin/PF02223.12/3.1e-45,AAA_28/PF13521.1/0.00044,AAA_14/PF13173.1/0.05,AAA_14/PF13173.1/8.3e+02,KTI12/PF08433.5/0.071,MobB/PF03205.9/0.25,MobB/PF03205.9/1.3e+03,DUF463/PF04317.7/0.18 TRINITY_DN8730_c0_g1_i1:63-740(+)